MGLRGPVYLYIHGVGRGATMVVILIALSLLISLL